MLLHVLLHEAGLLRDPLDNGEEKGFFVMVVELNDAVPAGAVEEEVFDVCGGVDVRGLVVDGVEGADEGVVCVGHVAGYGDAVVGAFQGALYRGGRYEGERC